MALSYRQVLERYDRAKAFGETRSLKDYSQGLNDLYQTDEFSEGLRDGPWTRFSTRADQYVFEPVASVTTEPLGGAIGGLFGQEEAGRAVGRGLPRAVANTAPLFIPGVGPIAGALGAGAAMAGQTYADTGNAKAAAVSGATGALLPAVGRLGGNVAAKALGVGERVGAEVLPTGSVGAFKAAQLAGSQTAQLGLSEAGAYGTQKILNPEEDYRPLSPEMLISQIPFTLLDIVGTATRNVPTAAEVKARTPTGEPAPNAKPYVPPKAADVEKARVESILTQYQDLVGDPNATAQAKSAALATIFKTVNEEPKAEVSDTTKALKELEKVKAPTDAPVASPTPAAAIVVNPKAASVSETTPATVSTSKPAQSLEEHDLRINEIEKRLQESGFDFTKVADPNTAAGKWLIENEGWSPMPEELTQAKKARDEFGGQLLAESRAQLTDGFTKLGLSSNDVKPILEYYSLGEGKDKGVDAYLANKYTRSTAARPKLEQVETITSKLANVRGESVPSDKTIQDASNVYELTRTYLGVEKPPIANPEAAGAVDVDSEAVSSIETKIAEAVTQLDTTPATPEDVQKIVEGAETVAKQKVDAGATPDQAARDVKLVKLGNEITRLQELSARLKENKGRTIVRDPALRAEAATQGFARLESMTPEMRLAVDTAIEGVYKNTSNAPRDKVAEDIGVVLYKWGEKGGTDVKALTRSIGGVSRTANKQASASMERFQENGKVVRFSNSNEAQEALTSKGLADKGYEVQQDSRSKTPYFYLAKRQFKAGDTNTSLDQQTVEGGPTLGESIGERDVATAPVASSAGEPLVGVDAVLQKVSQSVQDDAPSFYAEFLDEADPSPEQLEAAQHDVKRASIAYEMTREASPGSGVEFLNKLNARVKAAGLEEFDDVSQVSREMRTLREAATRYRDVSFRQDAEADESVAERMGLRQGMRGLMEHAATRDDVLGPVAEIVRGLNKAIPWDDVELVLPDHPDWDPSDGNFFSPGGHIGRDGLVRGPQINLRRLPGRSDEGRYLTSAVHEAVHYAEHFLSEKTDVPASADYRLVRDEVLSALRKSEYVPKDVRRLVDTLVRSDAYNKLNETAEARAGVVSQIQTGLSRQNAQWFDYVYAMLHPREMTATLFSNPHLVDVAANTKIRRPGGVVNTVLRVFSDGLRRLFGMPETGANAFETMLGGLDSYIGRSVLKKSYGGFDYLSDVLRNQGVRPDMQLARLQTLDRMYARGTLEASMTSFAREANREVSPEMRAALGQGDVKSVRQNVLKLLADDLPFYQDLWWRMKNDHEAVNGLVNEVKDGRILLGVPPNTEAQLKLSAQKLNAMGDALKRQATLSQRWRNLEGFTPEGAESVVADSTATGAVPTPADPTPVHDIAQAKMGLRSVAEVKSASSLAELEGRKELGFFEKTFGMSQFVKKHHPYVRPVMNGVQDVVGQANSWMLEMNMVYNSKNGMLDKAVQAANERVKSNPKLREVASDISRWIQEREKSGVTWDWSDPSLLTILKTLNIEDRNAVIQQELSHAARHAHWTNNVVPVALTQLHKTNTAAVIGANELGMLPDSAKKLASNIFDGLAALQDPMQAMAGTEILRQVSTQMQPMTFIKAVQYANDMIRATNSQLEFMRKRTHYASEKRSGQYYLRMVTPAGKAFSVSRDSMSELNKIRQAEELKGNKFLYVNEKAEPGELNYDADVMSTLQALDAQAAKRLEEALSDKPDVLEQVLPATQRAAEYQAAQQSFAPLPGLTRKFVAGREYIDMLQNSDDFYSKGTNWLRHKLITANTRLESMHPEIAGNSALKSYVNQYTQNFLTPDNQTARKLNEFTYYHRLAFNFGNSVLESFQNLTTGMQALISETGSVSDAYQLWGKAVKDITTHKTTGKWSSKDQEWFATRKTKEGRSGTVLWDDIFDPNREAVVKAHAAGGVAGKGLSLITHNARKFSSLFQRFNDDIGLFAGFELGRQKGMDLESAYQFALDTKNRGYYSGGKEQRPVGLFSIKTRAIPQMLSALNTYTLGWFNQMASDFKVGFGTAPAGTTATQRVGAKKAFLYGLAAQAALAGGLGLPGVGQGIAVLNQATGLDVKGWLRQNLAQLFEEDQEAGGLGTTLALKGLVAGFTPIDPSNRASISFPFLGVDPYKGFDVASLMGANVATLSDVAQGAVAALRGDLNGFAKAIPAAVRPAAQLFFQEGAVRDDRGALMYQLTPAERVFQTLGLTSSRVQNARDTARAVTQLNLAAQRENARRADDLARLFREGNVDEVQRQLFELQQTDPSVDLQRVVRNVARRVEAQTVPYDWRRDVNPAVHIQGLVNPAPSTELLRRQMRQAVEAQLGFPGRPNPMADVEAAQLDELLNSNPGLSLYQARQLLPGRQQAASQNNASWTEAFQ